MRMIALGMMMLGETQQ